MNSIHITTSKLRVRERDIKQGRRRRLESERERGRLEGGEEGGAGRLGRWRQTARGEVGWMEEKGGASYEGRSRLEGRKRS